MSTLTTEQQLAQYNESRDKIQSDIKIYRDLLKQNQDLLRIVEDKIQVLEDAITVQALEKDAKGRKIILCDDCGEWGYESEHNKGVCINCVVHCDICGIDIEPCNEKSCDYCGKTLCDGCDCSCEGEMEECPNCSNTVHESELFYDDDEKQMCIYCEGRE